MLDLLIHWNPSLHQILNNKRVWISNYCPICKYHNSRGKHFRYNTKLKIIKCYSCGGSTKNIHWLLYQIKNGRVKNSIILCDIEWYEKKFKRKIE